MYFAVFVYLFLFSTNRIIIWNVKTTLSAFQATIVRRVVVKLQRQVCFKCSGRSQMQLLPEALA